ncbi:MAG: hypothetical protein HY965_03180 [Ignavibacteriales bacterium]|nr:hypothetical protein [Ignavibacteriales bacterium]
MFRKYFITCLFFTILQLQAAPAQGVQLYDGTIGKAHIVMTLNFFKGDRITGSYYYKSVGKLINLSGTTSNNVLRMIGTVPQGDIDAGYGGEEFSGLLSNNEYFGNWSSGKTKLTFHLKLSKSLNGWEDVSNGAYVESKCDDGDTVGFSMSNYYMLPVYDKLPELRDSIIANVLGDYSSNKNNKQCLNEYLAANCKDEMLPDLRNNSLLEDHTIGSVCFCTGNVLVYKTCSGYQRLSAHANILVSYYLFNYKTGKRIQFDDIFVDFDKSKLAKLLANDKTKDVDPDNLDCNSIDGFYLTAKGIGFYFARTSTVYVEGSMDYYFRFKDLPFTLRKEFLKEVMSAE